MKPRSPLSLLLLTAAPLFAGAGCAHPPRPYVFATARPAGDTLTVLATALAHQGHRVAAVDRAGAEVVTYWEDTGYHFRETDDLEAETNIFLRYRVRVGGGDNQVTVRAEAQRCVPSGVIITREGVESTCIKMDGIFGTQQQAVDRLGAGLAAAVAAGAG